MVVRNSAKKIYNQRKQNKSYEVDVYDLEYISASDLYEPETALSDCVLLKLINSQKAQELKKTDVII